MTTIDKPSTDWNRIKAEYVATSKSLRELSSEYGVPWETLRKHSINEHWKEERTRTQAKAAQKVVDTAAKKMADNATLAADIKRKGLMILDGLFDDYAKVMATERRETKGNVVDIKRLRDLTAAYKDLTEDMQTGTSASNELLQSLLDLERGGNRG